MKKIIAALLCAVMLLGALIGCGEPKPTPTIRVLSAKETFVDTASKMTAQKEGAFTAALGALVDAKLFGDADVAAMFGDKLDVKLDMTGSFSEAAKQLVVALSASIKMGGTNVSADLTDVLVDGGTLYLNYKKVFDLMLMLQGYGGMVQYPYDSEYVAMTPADLGAGQTPGISEASYPKLQALAEHLKTVSEAALKEEYFAKTAAGAELTINKAATAELLTAVLNDMDANPAVYAEAYIEMARLGGAAEADIPTLDDAKAGIKDAVAEGKGFFATDEWKKVPEFTLKVKAEKTDAAYVMAVAVSGEGVSVTVDYTIAAGKVEKVTPPTGALTMEDIQGK